MNGFWKLVILLLAGLAVGAFLGGTILLNAVNTPKGPRVGQPLEGFQLDRLEGGKAQLADWKGKPVIINFWATWCIPCQDEMPLLQRTAQKVGQQAVFVGVNSQELPELVRNFAEKYGVTFPILLDSNGDLTQVYQLNGFPTTFFVDKDGVLRSMHIGVLREDLLTGYLRSIEVNP